MNNFKYNNLELSKYNPLPRIFYYDNFDYGFNGVTSLLDNYEDDLDNIYPG